jgi:hypothetical protein
MVMGQRTSWRKEGTLMGDAALTIGWAVQQEQVTHSSIVQDK